MESKVQRLQQLNPVQISAELKTSYREARRIANALKRYPVISDMSKNKYQMAKDIGRSERTVDQDRSTLIRNGLMEPWSPGRKKAEIGSLKRLNTQKSKPDITYRFSYITGSEMNAANLDPKGEYFCVVEPRDGEFLLRIFTPEQARKYRESQS